MEIDFSEVYEQIGALYEREKQERHRIFTFVNEK